MEAAAVAVEHLAVEAEPVPSILDSLAVAAEEAEEAVDTFTGTQLRIHRRRSVISVLGSSRSTSGTSGGSYRATLARSDRHD